MGLNPFNRPFFDRPVGARTAVPEVAKSARYPVPKSAASKAPRIVEADLLRWFLYRSADTEVLSECVSIRNAGLEFARIIVENTPSSADQTAAIRKVREAVMTAQAAIACGGK